MTGMREFILFLSLALTALTFGEQPWPKEVEGFAAPAAGEHPRLFFRKTDVPALREKAKTPEGKAMIERLKVTLGGGEEMPDSFRARDMAFGDKSKPFEQPVGGYSFGHAAGFGLLYQLTGDKKYADLGRECFEWAFEGVRDRDSKGRYGWLGDSGALRAGPTLGWYAVGYDLCYEGWDPEFREKVAAEIASYDQGKNSSLKIWPAGRATCRDRTTGGCRSAGRPWPCWRSRTIRGWI